MRAAESRLAGSEATASVLHPCLRSAWLLHNSPQTTHFIGQTTRNAVRTLVLCVRRTNTSSLFQMLLTHDPEGHRDVDIERDDEV